MATSAIIKFNDHTGDTAASIYIHYDGYPARNVGGLADDLVDFLVDTATMTDNRWNDASYFAAKFVVWYVLRYNSIDDAQKLDFLGIGICQTPTLCEYTYNVNCPSRAFGYTNTADNTKEAARKKIPSITVTDMSGVTADYEVLTDDDIQRIIDAASDNEKVD